MLKKSIYMLLAAGVLAIGMTAPAAEDKKQHTVQSQEQVRITEQHAAEVKAGADFWKPAGDTAMTQERTRTRERKMDATGDQDQYQDRNRERIHDPEEIGPGIGGGRGGSRK